LIYRATQEEVVLTYSKSDMILAVHSNASYLSEPFFLSTNAHIPPNNGAILKIAHVIKHIMSSATKAELDHPQRIRTYTTSNANPN
jgi:hypothetical protein